MEELVRRLRKKEESALRECMELYGHELVRLASLVMKDRYEAEDIVQESFILAFERITQLQEPNKLKKWLVSIMINQCRKQMRRWSFKNIKLKVEKDRVHEGIMDDTPEKEIMKLLEGQSLSQKIQELDEKYRVVIALFYFEECSVKEIAELTLEKENTIKSRLARGRKLLKEKLEGDDDE